MFCTSWIFTAGSDSKWPPDIPPFLLEQKRRKPVQEALVKETVLNDEVEGSEQRGCSLLEEMSVIPPFFGLSSLKRDTFIHLLC
jgi:hypothetical protein